MRHGLFFAALYLRYKSQPKDRPRRTKQPTLKTAKSLFAALLAWMAISYSLRHTLAKMDGADICCITRYDAVKTHCAGWWAILESWRGLKLTFHLR
jgi:hypothetical protein